MYRTTTEREKMHTVSCLHPALRENSPTVVSNSYSEMRNTATSHPQIEQIHPDSGISCSKRGVASRNEASANRVTPAPYPCAIRVSGS